MVARQRQLIVEDTDGSPSQKSDDEGEDDGKEPSARDLRMASIDAIAKFTDYSEYFTSNCYDRHSAWHSDSIRQRRAGGSSH